MNARTYVILRGDEPVDRFLTGPTAERSADENAVANLIDYTAHHPGGRHLLVYLDPHDATLAVPLCSARDGVGTLLVSLDDLSADLMHTGPTVAAAATACA